MKSKERSIVEDFSFMVESRFLLLDHSFKDTAILFGHVGLMG